MSDTTTTPTGRELREMIAEGIIDYGDAAVRLHPERLAHHPAGIYPWEGVCRSEDPADDCRIVASPLTSLCYSCWMEQPRGEADGPGSLGCAG